MVVSVFVYKYLCFLKGVCGCVEGLWNFQHRMRNSKSANEQGKHSLCQWELLQKQEGSLQGKREILQTRCKRDWGTKCRNYSNAECQNTSFDPSSMHPSWPLFSLTHLSFVSLSLSSTLSHSIFHFSSLSHSLSLSNGIEAPVPNPLSFRAALCTGMPAHLRCNYFCLPFSQRPPQHAAHIEVAIKHGATPLSQLLRISLQPGMLKHLHLPYEDRCSGRHATRRGHDKGDHAIPTRCDMLTSTHAVCRQLDLLSTVHKLWGRVAPGHVDHSHINDDSLSGRRVDDQISPLVPRAYLVP